MIRFMSKAAASFIMFDDHAKAVLEAAGDDWAYPGIWRVERLAEILQTLTAVSAASAQRAQQAERAAWTQAIEDGAEPGAFPVGFHQRLMPVLEMLQAAQAASQPIVWEREGA